MQYNLYTVSVTNGSNIVNGALGTKFLSKVTPGNSFKIKGDPVIYQIASVVSDTQLTLSTPFQGVTAVNQQYQVTTDYTPNFGFAEINVGDQDWPTHLTVETLRKIDSTLAYAAGEGLKFQGDWNASTNAPAIPAASTANLGHFYKVAVSGTTSVSGISQWAVGDAVISNGTYWFRISLPEYAAEEYATAAAASATSAAASATTATTKASEASTSATSAAASATTATTKATSAAASATSATASAATATTKASEAATSATTATTKASEAATSSTTATTKAAEAAASATAAATAKLAAEAARDQALTAFDNFDDRYLGQKAADPTVDNDGNPLVAGALYFNTAAIGAGGGMRVYDGSIWVAAYASLDSTLAALAGVTTAADKLIYATGVDTFATATLTSTARALLDDTSTSAMRTTLGLGTAATTAATDYAVAAKGVTNGDSHDHVGGDGAAISLTSAVTGVLPVANGGTGSSTQNFVDLTANQTIAGNKTFTGAVTAPSFVSSVATGTAPFTVSSNTMVTNLNAEMIGGTKLSNLMNTTSDQNVLGVKHFYYAGPSPSESGVRVTLYDTATTPPSGTVLEAYSPGNLRLQTIEGGTGKTAAIQMQGGNIGITGPLSITGTTSIPLGTAAAPSLTFSGDTNTGIYSPAADTVGIATGGVQRVGIADYGLTYVATGTNNAALRASASGTGYAGLYLDASDGDFAGGDYFWIRQNNDLTTEIAQLGAYDLLFKTANTERFRILSTGALLGATCMKLVGIDSTSTSVSTDTVDGTDNKRLQLAGGGSPSDTRGAYINLHGNEHATFPGVLSLLSGNTGTDYINFWTANSERARITSSGAVLINTVTPQGTASEKLEVKGNVLVKDSVNAQTVRVETGLSTGYAGLDTANDSTSLGILRTYGSAHATVLWGTNIANSTFIGNNGASCANLFVGTVAAAPILFGTSNAERARITSSGNLLVGRTTDATYPKLQVGNANPAASPTYSASDLAVFNAAAIGIIHVQAPTSSGYGFSSDTTRLAGYIGYTHSLNQMEFRTNAATKMLLTTEGYLIVNNTGSVGAYPLQVNGHGYFNGNIASTGGLFWSYGAGSWQFRNSGKSTILEATQNDGTGLLYLRSGSSSTSGSHVVIADAYSGNTLIGANVEHPNPAKTQISSTILGLSVKADTADTARFWRPVNTVSAAAGRILLGGYVDTSTYGDYASIGAIIENSALATKSGAIAFSSATGGALTEKARITASGELLVGISSPISTGYQIQTNSSNNSATGSYWRNNSTGTGASVRMALGSSNDVFQIVKYGSDYTARSNETHFYNGVGDMYFSTNAGTERLRITQGGNILVGTTTDDGANRIQVQSAGKTGAVFIDSNSYATGVGGGIKFAGRYDATNSATFAGIQGEKENSTSGNYAGALVFLSRAQGEGTVEGMRLTSAKNLLIGTSTDPGYGSKIHSTAGISLGNTAVANGNVLDWYEEGTFTATVAGGTTVGTGTYTTQIGRYTRIGRSVSIQIQLAWTAHTGTGTMTITGLPFANIATTAATPLAVSYDGLVVGAGKQLCAYIGSGVNTVIFVACDPAGGSVSYITIDSAVNLLLISGTYFVP